MKEKPKKNRWKSALLTLVLSPVVCGLAAGLIGVAIILISYLIRPSSVTVGSGPDPWGVSLLFFLSWGFAGVLAGTALGILIAIVIAIRG